MSRRWCRSSAFVTLLLVALHAPEARSSTVRLACHGWNTAPAGCFDEATTDTLSLFLPALLGTVFGPSPYHFGILSIDGPDICPDFVMTESDAGCSYDLTAWFEPGAVAIGHLTAGDQNAQLDGAEWLGHAPTEFSAIRIEFEQGAPCSDTRTIWVPIKWVLVRMPAMSGAVAAWGNDHQGQCAVPEPNSEFVAVAGGSTHSLGLRRDGSIATWGDNSAGQLDVPAPNIGFLSIAAGANHGLGLRGDGSMIAWGADDFGQSSVPQPNSGYVKVSANGDRNLGLRLDGSVRGWGWNQYGQNETPTPNAGFVDVAAGSDHSLGLKGDGSVLAWGGNYFGQCDVPAPNAEFIAIAANQHHSIGLKRDGSVVAWGDNTYGECDPPDPNTGFVSIAAGEDYNLGLRTDGSITAWGRNGWGQCNVPLPNSAFTAVAAGWTHSLAIQMAPGACCRLDGSCLATLASACQSPDVWQGDNTTCDPNPCPQPTRACCFAEGVCSLLTEAQCASEGGVPSGETCDPNPCPQPTGACCLVMFCTEDTEAQCNAWGGTFQGNGVACVDSLCITSGVAGTMPRPAGVIRVSPNPTAGATTVTVARPMAGHVSVAVFDAAGRVVRTVTDRRHPAGIVSLSWDGQDASGREVPGGVYFVRVTTDRGAGTKLIVVAR